MPRFARSAVECGASSHRLAPQEDQEFSSYNTTSVPTPASVKISSSTA